MPTLRLLQYSLVLGFVLGLVKALAWVLTGSTAVLADALESLANILAAAFAWYSLRLSQRPRDQNHPYGHGKIEFFSAGLEGLLVLGAGMGILLKAIYDLLEPVPLQRLPWGMALTLAAGLLNGAMGAWLWSQHRRRPSTLLRASALHLLTDLVSSLGLVLALAMVYLTGWRWVDPLVALLLAGYILYTGAGLVRQAYAGLMDEADPHLVEKLLRALLPYRQPAWVDLHNLRLQQYGADLHLDAHLTLPRYWTLDQVHAEVAHIEQIINHEMGRPVEVFLHVDPCLPDCCSHCQLAPCPMRSADFHQRIDWTPENVLPNQKHSLASVSRDR